MKALKILHAADLHLDSAFEGLGQAKAAQRRREQRELLSRLCALAAREQVDIVLLSGDLLDSGSSYFETGRELVRALGDMGAPVFIAPGNHDYICPSSPYMRLDFPENVHLFTENEIEYFELPELRTSVYGAAFTDTVSPPLLCGFAARRREGWTNLLCLHGELARTSPYDPITEAELASSGIDYAALGHIHRASGLCRAGETWYSWPGCPEGRGFDECGEKYVNIIELGDNGCQLRQESVAGRRYELLRVDVSGTEPLLAIHAAMPEDTARDVYRIILTGETDTAPELARLQDNLSELFFAVQLRDETRLRRDIWARAGENSLRGVFLEKLRALYAAAGTEDERRQIERAARWGLAALDNMEEVVSHENR